MIILSYCYDYCHDYDHCHYCQYYYVIFLFDNPPMRLPRMPKSQQLQTRPFIQVRGRRRRRSTSRSAARTNPAGGGGINIGSAEEKYGPHKIQLKFLECRNGPTAVATAAGRRQLNRVFRTVRRICDGYHYSMAGEAWIETSPGVQSGGGGSCSALMGTLY